MRHLGTPLHRNSLLIALLLTVFSAGQARAASAGFVYALREVSGGANQIYGFQLDAISGALTPLSGFPVASGGNGSDVTVSEQVAYDAINSRLYVVNDGSDTLSAFSVNPMTGALTALPFSPISLGNGNWFCAAVHPSGSPVIVGGNNDLASFVVTGASATAAPGSPFNAGTSVFSCKFSRDGSHIYAGGNGGSDIAAFAVSGTGVLAAISGSPFSAGSANPVAYATDIKGRLFVTNFESNQVRVFMGQGGLTPATGNPFTSGLSQAVHGILHPAGYYMVADRAFNQIGVYKIAGTGAATTLTAAPGSPFATGGAYTDAIAFTRNGFLVAANGDSRNLTVFQIDAAQGILTRVDAQQAANSLGNAGRLTGLVIAGGLTDLDFDGDAIKDIAVYRSTTGEWLELDSSGHTTVTPWGSPAFDDIPVPADYDGDGRTDIAVFRRTTGEWFVRNSSDGTSTIGWGAPSFGDIPVPADYDGDGKADIAVYRDTTGQWFVLGSSVGFFTMNWGAPSLGDIPVPADYDGDGKADVAIYRDSTGEWFVAKSAGGGGLVATWGWAMVDIPVPADYDGDGKADIAVYREPSGQWFVLKSGGGFTSIAWGAPGDIPVPGDYDGDGKVDIAVYRGSTGEWFVLKSGGGTSTTVWGTDSLADLPIALDQQ
jgi:6-phosphogluconolactonase (cycloisomerase 2 family)